MAKKVEAPEAVPVDAKFTYKYEVLIGDHCHGINTYHKGDTFETDHELVGVDAPGVPQKLKLVSKTKA